MTDPVVLEGFVSVQAALQSGSRDLHAIYVRRDKWDTEAAWLENQAKAANIPLQRVETAVIDSHAGGSTHGGVVALAGPRKFVDLAQIGADQPAPFVVMIDGVEDPFNFGQAVRALYAAGADGLIVRPRNWMSAASVVARASAGATERIPTAIAETARDAASFFKGRGLRVACATLDKAIPLYDADLTVPLFMVIGGEKRGITRSFLESADLRLAIPYGRDFAQSLGTATAAAVIGFEVMRQRHR
jgi:23S rRNA (guanosine2251-2'-O)-methyltransferase